MNNKKYFGILADSEKRILKYINKVLDYEGLKLNKYKLNTMENKNMTLGRCINKRLILIQKSLLDSGIKEDIDSVVAHEILHCAEGTRGHCKTWKSLVSSVNEIAPFKIYQYSNETMKSNPTLLNNYKYILRCEKCNGIMYMYKKKTNFVKLVMAGGFSNTRCRMCGKISKKIKVEVK